MLTVSTIAADFIVKDSFTIREISVVIFQAILKTQHNIKYQKSIVLNPGLYQTWVWPLMDCGFSSHTSVFSKKSHFRGVARVFGSSSLGLPP